MVVYKQDKSKDVSSGCYKYHEYVLRGRSLLSSRGAATP